MPDRIMVPLSKDQLMLMISCLKGIKQQSPPRLQSNIVDLIDLLATSKSTLDRLE